MRVCEERKVKGFLNSFLKNCEKKLVFKELLKLEHAIEFL